MPWLVGFDLWGSWWDLREEQSCSKCEGVAGETHIPQMERETEAEKIHMDQVGRGGTGRREGSG